jgi:hypothetical protein
MLRSSAATPAVNISVTMPQRRRVRVVDQGTVEQPDSSPPAPPVCACPRLGRDEWHETESDWSDIAFLRSSIGAVMGVPVGYGSARHRLEREAAARGLTVPEDAMVLLGAGRLRRPLLLEVEDVPAGARGVARPGGVAYSRLVPAPLGEMKDALGQTRRRARERYGRKPDDMWVWYLTCRFCSAERDFETLFIAHYRQAP